MAKKVTKKKVASKKKRATKKASGKKRSKKKTSGSLLDEQLGEDEGGLFLVIHAHEGMGKTSFAGQFEDPIYIVDAQEKGVQVLKKRGLLPKDTPVLSVDAGFDPENDDSTDVTGEGWLRLLEMCDKLLVEDHGRKTAVFETMTGFQTMVFLYAAEKEFGGDFTATGFFSYQQGQDIVRTKYWPVFMGKLEDIRASGMNVILTAHSQIKTHTEPGEESVDRHIPFCDRRIWKLCARQATAVLFMHDFLNIEKQRGKKAKATDNIRLIQTTRTAVADAKNWLGLPETIDAGESAEEAYENFMGALNEV